MNDLINDIEKACNIYFIDNNFRLIKKGFLRYEISGNNMTLGVNNYRKEKEEVKVLHWFENYWIYIGINFKQKEKKDSYPETFITISVFQGEANDNVKSQLFRAEWDNYEDNLKHPQPHWHIYPFKYDSKTYEDFETFNDMKNDQNSGFEASLVSNNKLVDISNIHFAMKGQWSETDTHIHKINDNKSIVLWFNGVLGHIKEQLEYVKNV